jgi:hypothetical protein
MKTSDTIVTKLRCGYELYVTRYDYKCSVECCNRYRVALYGANGATVYDIPITWKTDLRKAGRALTTASYELGK